MKCKCGGEYKDTIKTWDFMGNKEPFEYGVCGTCKSWRLLTRVDDIGKYYAKDYYSYESRENPGTIAHFRRVAKVIIEENKLTEHTSILDYGAGSILLLKGFYGEGVGIDGQLHKLRAYDKYAPAIEWKGIKLQNTIPTDMTFDFILSKHCIEHEQDPTEQLKTILNLLSDKGKCCIVAPNPDSIEANYFKGYWIGIDGPRHLNLWTIPLMTETIKALGGEVIKTGTLGDPSGYLTSEMYLKGGMWKDRDKMLQGTSDDRMFQVYNFSKVLEEIGQADMLTITFIKNKREDLK